MDALAGALLVAGSAFVLIAAVGIVRFDHIYARMHTAAKAPTLGIVLVALGVGLELRSVRVGLTLGLVAALQLVAAPVGAHLLGRSVYYHLRPPLEGPDDLADHDAWPDGRS